MKALALPVRTVNGWIFSGSGGENQMDGRDQSANGADVDHHDDYQDNYHDDLHDHHHYDYYDDDDAGRS